MPESDPAQHVRPGKYECDRERADMPTGYARNTWSARGASG